VVAGDGKGAFQALERACVGVGDVGCFAVHGRGLDDCAAEGLADGLMAEAYAEEGDVVFGGGFYEVEADAGMVWVAWAGGDHEAFRVFGKDFIDGDFVVAIDACFDI